jgi:hypothetical protein
MKPAQRARTRARKNVQPERLDEAFDAQQRWVLIGIGVLLSVALISFALDWFRDPVVHRILLILLAIAGVGVIVAARACDIRPGQEQTYGRAPLLWLIDRITL